MPLLSLAEAIYHHLYQRRRAQFGGTVEDAGCKVVAVGNLTTGGTGKTPAVQWVARLLQAQEACVGVVARGYGGQLSPAGAVVSDGAKTLLSAAEAGDEPVLHARALPGVPVVIGRDRVAAARRAAQEFGLDALVLDDAFQYWSLRRDCDLVLLDARRPFDNGHLLPRGRLREPPSELRRADALLLTRADLATPEQFAAAREQVARFSKAPVFAASHTPVALRDEATGERLPLETLRGLPVFAASALADNAAFATTLERCGAALTGRLGRRDHHHWRLEELQRLPVGPARAVVTTEKDAVKLHPDWVAPLPLWSLVIELRVADDAALRTLILERCGF